MGCKGVQETHWFFRVNFSGIVPWFVTEMLGDEVDTDCISPWEEDFSKIGRDRAGPREPAKVTLGIQHRWNRDRRKES